MHMTKQQFNFEEIFSFAWVKTKQHAWFMACTFVIYAVILSAVMLNPVLEILVALLIALSLLSISFIIVRDQSFNFSDLFNKLRSPNLVIKFLALTVIYVTVVSVLVIPFAAASSLAFAAFVAGVDITFKLMLVLATTLVMLVPGIYIAVRFKFYPFVLLENEHLKIVDIIKHTNKITCCAFWQLFFFFIVLAVLNIIGMLAFVVGLFLTVPVSIFAMAHLFRKLEGHSH